MMQETGNKCSANSIEILSIQLTLNGLSFYVDQESGNGYAAQKEQICLFDPTIDVAQGVAQLLKTNNLLGGEYARVNIVFDTDNVTFVPEELFEQELVVNYIKINSLLPDDNFTAISSPAICGIRAVMAIATPIAALLQQFYPHARYYSPLQENLLRKRANSMEITLTKGIAYITLSDTSLQRIETLPFTTTADLIYYIKEMLGSRAAHHIYITGHNSTEIAKLCQRYWSLVSCQQQTHNLFDYENN